MYMHMKQPVWKTVYGSGIIHKQFPHLFNTLRNFCVTRLGAADPGAALWSTGAPLLWGMFYEWDAIWRNNPCDDSYTEASDNGFGGGGRDLEN